MEVVVTPLKMEELPRDTAVFPLEMDVLPTARAVLPSVMLVLPIVAEATIVSPCLDPGSEHVRCIIPLCAAVAASLYSHSVCLHILSRSLSTLTSWWS